MSTQFRLPNQSLRVYRADYRDVYVEQLWKRLRGRTETPGPYDGVLNPSIVDISDWKFKVHEQAEGSNEDLCSVCGASHRREGSGTNSNLLSSSTPGNSCEYDPSSDGKWKANIETRVTEKAMT